MNSEKEIIRNRSLRWVLVAFSISIAPLLISILIVSLNKGGLNNINELIFKYIIDGTFIVIGLTIQGSKIIDFTYSRDFDLMNNFLNSCVLIPFLLNAILGVAMYTFLNTNEAIKAEHYENINFFWVYFFTILIIVVSVVHTIYMQRTSLRFLRNKGELYLPTVDGEMNCEICKSYHENYFIDKMNKLKLKKNKREKEIKISKNSIIKDKFEIKP